jgi:hypothetical protein
VEGVERLRTRRRGGSERECNDSWRLSRLRKRLSWDRADGFDCFSGVNGAESRDERMPTLRHAACARDCYPPAHIQARPLRYLFSNLGVIKSSPSSAFPLLPECLSAHYGASQQGMARIGIDSLRAYTFFDKPAAICMVAMLFYNSTLAPIAEKDNHCYLNTNPSIKT